MNRIINILTFVFIITLNLFPFENKDILIIEDSNKLYNLENIFWQFKLYDKDIREEKDLINALNSEFNEDNSIFIKLPHGWTNIKNLKDVKNGKFINNFSLEEITKISKEQNRIGIYRLKIYFNEIKDKSFGIVLNKIDNCDVTYFNGVEIGRTGYIFKDSKKGNLYYDLRRIYEIPSSLIKKGENTLTIVVRGYFNVAQGSGLFELPYVIGNFNRLVKDIYFKDFIEAGLIIIFLILFIYYLILFIYQNNKFDFLFFSLVSLFCAFYFFLVNPLKYEILPIRYFLFFKGLEYGILFIVFGVWLHFIVFLFKNKIWTRVTIAIDIYTILSLIYLVVTNSPILFNRFNFYVNMFIEFFILIYTLYLIFKYAIFYKSTEARLLIIGLTIFILLVINDILLAQNILNKTERLATFGFTIFVLQIAFLLGNRYQKLLKETIKANKNLKLLYESSIKMSENSNIETNNINILSDLIVELACKFVDAKRGSLLLLADDEKKWIIKSIFDENNNSNELKNKIIEIEETSPSFWVLKNKKSLLVPDINESNFIKKEKYKKDSFVIFPLIVKNRVFGCVNITEKINEDLFTENDLNLLNAFSSAASITLENAILNKKVIEKERLEKEMEIAQKIQTAILPKNFNSKNFEISGIMIPTEEVGGDYFDYVNYKNREWFCIGDVTGHGVTSGLIMMMTQSIINSLIKADFSTPKDIISILNKTLYDNIHNRLKTNDYITLSIFCYDNYKLLYSGLHTDFLLYRKKDNKIERIETKGLWSGIVEDVSEFNNNLEIQIEKDDIVLLFTDGVIEAMNSNNELYGYERVIDIFYKNINNKCDEILKNIIEDIKKFYYIQKDDITLLCIRKII